MRSGYPDHVFHQGQYLGGTGAYTLAAGIADIIIHNWYTVDYLDALFGTYPLAFEAFDTAYLAVLYNLGFFGIPVGAQGDGSGPIPRYEFKKQVGTGGDTESAAGTFRIVDMGYPVGRDMNRVKGTGNFTVPEPDTAEIALFCAIHGDFCGLAGFYADIVSLGLAMFEGALTAENHNPGYRLRSDTHDFRNFFRDFGSAGSASINRSIAANYRGGKRVAAGESTGAAVGARQGFTNQRFAGVGFHMEYFLEKSEQKAQKGRKTQRNSKCC